MKTLLQALLALGLIVAVPTALTGCETEEQLEIEEDGDRDVDTEITLDDDAVDEAEADMNELGEDIEAGANEAGAAIRDAAQDAENAIDENIDLGDNAGTPEVDDNN